MPESVKRYKLLFDDVEVTDPLNWPSFTPLQRTHEFYKTVFTEITERKVILIKDAKAAADTAYENDGVAASIDVKWQEWNDATSSYDNAYSLGKLSFKPGHYRKMREETEVKFEPVGFITRLLARDKITCDLQDLTDISGDAITSFSSETENVSIESYLLKKTAECRDRSVTTINQTVGTTSDYVTMPIRYSEIEGSLGIEIIEIDDGAFYNSVPDNNVKFLENGDLSVRLDVYLGYILDSTANIGAQIKILYQLNSDSPVVLASDEILVTEVLTNVVDTLSYTNSFSISGVSITDTFKIYARIDNTGAANLEVSAVFVNNVEEDNSLPYTDYPGVSFNQDTSYQTTTITGMLVWEYLLRICQKITGRNDCLRSPLFGRTDGEVYTYSEDGDWSMLLISSVYLLRGYPIASFPLQDTLRDAFHELDCMFSIALGITYESGVPYIKIDREKNFYDSDTVVMTLSAKDPGIEWEPSINHIWGTVKSGFRNFEEKDTGTLGTTHSTRQYSIAGLDEVIGREYNIESEWIASTHLIEALRRKRYNTNATKDEDFNKKKVVLHVKRDGGGGYELVLDENFASVSAFDNSDTAYNLHLTPARLTMNHAPLLLSGILRTLNSSGDKSFLKYQSGTGKTSVTTRIDGDGGVLNEEEDHDTDELTNGNNEPLFDASFLGTFTAKTTRAQRALFRSGFTGVIQVQDGDDLWLGFLYEKRDRDLVNQESEIKILRANTGYIQYLGTDENIEYLGTDGGDPIEWLGN